MNRMFCFDAARYTEPFASRGFVHVARGLAEDFHARVQEQLNRVPETARLREFALGQKQQTLYELPPGADYLGELLDTVATVAGLDRRELVLSERHVKAYEADAVGEAPPHKDRWSSQVAVGITVKVPPGSRLVLYPDVDVGPNPFNSTAELRESLSPEQRPETILRQAPRVEIEDAPRDVLVFRGNAIWHRRSNRAGAVMLYLKLNAFGSDPLGEDPGTPRCRALTERVLAEDDARLARSIPRIGRRVDRVERRYARDWSESLAVVVWGEPAFSIDERDLLTLRAIDGRRTVAAALSEAGLGSRQDGASRIRRLAARGVIDLSPAEPA